MSGWLRLAALVVVATLVALAWNMATTASAYAYDGADRDADARVVGTPVAGETVPRWALQCDGRNARPSSRVAVVATEAGALPVHAPGSLSLSEARTFYWQGEGAIAALGDDLAARGVGLEAQARELFETRNALRSHVRDVMADQVGAEYLRRSSPNLTWDEMVARKAGRPLRR